MSLAKALVSKFLCKFYRNLRPFETVLVEPCAAYGPFERQRKPICLECLEPPLSVILKSERQEGRAEEEEEEGGDYDELCGSCKFPICHDTRCRQSHAESGECEKLQAWKATRISILISHVTLLVTLMHVIDISIRL